MKEIWRNIKGYEGLYQVSNFGKVLSMKSKKELKVIRLHDGYLYINLYKNRKCKKNAIHRLVAQAFILNHNNKPQVDHINGDKFNNNVTNLRWVTQSENMMGYGYEQRKATLKKVMCRTHPIKAIQTSTNTAMRFNSPKEASKHGFDYSHILKCLKGIEKTHKGFIFEEVV